MAFDMNVACSSATFGIKTAADMLAAGTANVALVVNPEICSGHLNFRDRDSHFIFGDACTAVLLERETDCKAANPWQLVASKLVTQYSNNIRNNFGFLNRLSPRTRYGDDKLFRQQGRKVFKEVLPLVCDQIANQLDEQGWPAEPEPALAPSGQPHHEPVHRSQAARSRCQPAGGAGHS